MASQIRHGTHSGYTRHQQLKIPVCDSCRQARRDYDNKHTKLKRAVAILDGSPDWADQAACIGQEQLFFGLTDRDVHTAKEICLSCPVTRECAAQRVYVESVVNGPAVGVWAGVHYVGDTSGNTARQSRKSA